MPKAPPRRRQRPHDALPAGFQWREGKPRWIPSPTRRAQGWKAMDLKDGHGKKAAFLARGPAISKAELIAYAVNAWAKGAPVPSSFIQIAPKGAELKGLDIGANNPRCIGVLLDAYLASPAFLRDIAPTTQVEYRSKIKRFLEAAACPHPPLLADGAVDRVAIDKKVEAFRAFDMSIFEAPKFGSTAPFVLEEVYDHLRDTAGDHVAYGALRSISAWFGWCKIKKRLWETNPCSMLEIAAPGGRIRSAKWEELVALVTAADALGHHSIADAIILAVDLSWSQQDLLALRWDQVNAKTFHVKHRRLKTGNAGNPRLLAIGQARMETIKARWAQEKVRPTHVLICERTGQPWDKFDFRHRMTEIRAHAVESVPSCATLKFLDLRDTAVTYGIDAGLTIEQVCSRTLHSLKRAREVIEKHYGEIGQGVADDGADKLDAHFKKMGYRF